MKDVVKMVENSFNPYFNGYSTLTNAIRNDYELVTHGFNPYFNGYSTLTNLDDINNSNVKFLKDSFNPYFNGYSTLTHLKYNL